MLTQLKKFLELDGQRQLMLLRSFAALGMARYQLSQKPFKELTSGLELHRGPFDQSPLTPDKEKSARIIGWAIRTAARYAPWKSTCLVQVLAAQNVLARHSIAGAFYIGAVPTVNEQENQLDAHAWLKCGGHYITGEPGHDRYQVVSTFSWH